MLKILGDMTIQLTRGDTAALTIDIVDEVTSTQYEVAPNDTITLSVKKTVNDRTYYFQKIVTGTNRIIIEPSDTQKLGFGTYIYDVQLDKASGEVSTVLGPATFELLTEVTW
jgi:hypothetical protein